MRARKITEGTDCQFDRIKIDKFKPSIWFFIGWYSKNIAFRFLTLGFEDVELDPFVGIADEAGKRSDFY